jgi:hypothetical protein
MVAVQGFGPCVGGVCLSAASRPSVPEDKKTRGPFRPPGSVFCAPYCLTSKPCPKPCPFLAQNTKKGIPDNENPLMISSGWGIRIRTLIHGVRVRCPTIERSPNKFKLLTYKEIARQGLPKALAGVLHLLQFQRFGTRGSLLVFRRSVPSDPSSGLSSVSPGGSQN